jgi:hypothetical protein
MDLSYPVDGRKKGIRLESGKIWQKKGPNGIFEIAISQKLLNRFSKFKKHFYCLTDIYPNS